MRVALRLLVLLLVVLLAACSGPAIQGLAGVEILGGDRNVPQGATALLTVEVTAGSGVATTVTWSSSDESVASVDAGGLVTALKLGSTTITATSTADATKSDSIGVAVIVPEGAIRATFDTALPFPVLGAALVMIDTSSAFGPASLVEIEEGTYLGPVSSIDDEGGFNVQLPLGSELPPVLLKSATALVGLLEELPDCQLQVSKSGVSVTEAVAQQLPYAPVPAIALIGSFGGALTMATAVPFDPTWSDEEFYSQEFGTWVYATDGVSVNSTGTGCTDPGSLIAYTVDVDLVAGWNQLAWTYDLDATTTNFSSFNLRNTSTTVWHLFPMLR